MRFAALQLRQPGKAFGLSRKQSGNALMEYVVPAAIILLSAGLLVTLADTSKLLGLYFLSASGRTVGSLNGTTLKLKGLAENATGDSGIGLAGFSGSQFGSVSGGNSGTAGIFWSGTVTRTGGRYSGSSSEYF